MTSTDYQKMFTRYFQKVKMGPGCWEWTAAKHPAGYGTMRVGRKLKKATHISFLLTNNRWPHKHLQINHHDCDNKACVRPSHIYEGTKKQNARDAVERGQIPTGADHHNAKLTTRTVQTVKTYWRTFGNRNGPRQPRSPGSITERELAAKAGIKPGSLHLILTGQSWPNVPYPGWEDEPC